MARVQVKRVGGQFEAACGSVVARGNTEREAIDAALKASRAQPAPVEAPAPVRASAPSKRAED
jgi:hypothetical protein